MNVAIYVNVKCLTMSTSPVSALIDTGFMQKLEALNSNGKREKCMFKELPWDFSVLNVHVKSI